MNQELLTNVVLVLISTFGSALALIIGNAVRQANARAKKEHWYALVHEFAETAVAAAEQLGLTGQLEELASGKYNYAIGLMEAMLQDNGIKMDLDVPMSYLQAILEAEVNRLPSQLVGEVLHSK